VTTDTTILETHCTDILIVLCLLPLTLFWLLKTSKPTEAVSVKDYRRITIMEIPNGQRNGVLKQTGEEVRLDARSGDLKGQTSGMAPSYVQANLIVLPSRYANDFRLLCQRNPVPCPLLAESCGIGVFNRLKSWVPGITDKQMADNIDIRRDFPKYTLYQDGKLLNSECFDVEEHWAEDQVGFLVGCSYSFESALAAAGLVPAHMAHQRNVPMYRTKLPLCPAGVFTQSSYVVSMRPYQKRDVERVRDITRPFVSTHGEPIAWGWDAVQRLGIHNIQKPEFGDSPVALDGTPFSNNFANPDGDDELIPIFWGCGVTPQEAVRSAQLEGIVIGHAPGHMIVLDITDNDLVST
jgi:uncharacterized protein YcsI (UPF0317 family)